jgi:coiled-coil domain-containing protein 12
MEERRARIAALRAKAGRTSQDANEDDNDTENTKHPPVLRVLTLINSLETPPTKKQKDGRVEKKESVLLLALREAQAEASSTSKTALTDLDGLAPKKLNADLKREIQPKLQKLEKRTQKVIVSLLRERLEREATAEIDE